MVLNRGAPELRHCTIVAQHSAPSSSFKCGRSRPKSIRQFPVSLLVYALPTTGCTVGLTGRRARLSFYLEYAARTSMHRLCADGDQTGASELAFAVLLTILTVSRSVVVWMRGNRGFLHAVLLRDAILFFLLYTAANLANMVSLVSEMRENVRCLRT